VVKSTETHESEVQHGPGAAAGKQAVPDYLQFASSVGNQNFGRIIARLRDGEGIMADGTAHPDVTRAVAAARGAGRPLNRSVRETLESGFGTSLASVRVHENSPIAPKVLARAFAVGQDIHLAPGESATDLPLMAHEASHTIQQRGAPDTGTLAVSQPGDPLERAADAAVGDLFA
jgi:hypothetical protein